MTMRQRVCFRVDARASVVTAGIDMVGQLAPPPAPADETEATLERGNETTPIVENRPT